MSKHNPSSRSTQTTVSRMLATLLMSSGFVMTLPVQNAHADGTTNTVQCGSPNFHITVDCGVGASMPALSVTNLTAGQLSVTNETIGQLTATNVTIGQLTATNGSIANLTTTNLSTSNFTTTNLTTTNFSTTNFSTANLTTTNLNTTNLTATNFSTTNFSTANLTTTNLSTTNLTATNFSTTNFSAANISAGSLNASSANVGNLTATNTSTTNLTAGSATINNSLAVKPGATVDMGGNRVQNVVGGVQDTDAANVGQVRTLEKLANRQGAIAAAANAMPLATTGAVGEITVGAGVGSSGGQAALAVGLASRITENLVLKGAAGVSGSTSSVGVGIGYTFK